LVIDEISQIALRPFLKLSERQAPHGFAIKGLGDWEQVQSIEAGGRDRPAHWRRSGAGH
jgi:hypothetical protein